MLRRPHCWNYDMYMVEGLGRLGLPLVASTYLTFSFAEYSDVLVYLIWPTRGLLDFSPGCVFRACLTLQ
jgi:hypothetical protein